MWFFKNTNRPFFFENNFFPRNLGDVPRVRKCYMFFSADLQITGLFLVNIYVLDYHVMVNIYLEI